MTEAGHAESAHDQAIRRDERLRLAELFEENRHVLGNFVIGGGPKMIDLLAFILRLDNPAAPTRHAWGGHRLDDAGSDGPVWRVECSGCDWSIEAPQSEAMAAGRKHEDDHNPVSIRGYE